MSKFSDFVRRVFGCKKASVVPIEQGDNYDADVSFADVPTAAPDSQPVFTVSGHYIGPTTLTLPPAADVPDGFVLDEKPSKSPEKLSRSEVARRRAADIKDRWGDDYFVELGRKAAVAKKQKRRQHRRIETSYRRHGKNVFINAARIRNGLRPI